MKKITFLLNLLLIIILSGCCGNSSNSSNSSVGCVYEVYQGGVKIDEVCKIVCCGSGASSGSYYKKTTRTCNIRSTSL